MSVFERPPTKSIPHASNYPAISNVSITAFGLVTWTTDVASTSQLFYGKSFYRGQSTAQDPALVTSHSVQIPNLALATTYYLKVASFHIDALSVSDLYSFMSSPYYSALILYSPDTTRWAVTVGIAGNLISTATPSGPPGDDEPADFVLRDSSSVYWTVSISNLGALITTSGGIAADSVDSIPLDDSAFVTWTLTVTTTGGLKTT